MLYLGYQERMAAKPVVNVEEEDATELKFGKGVVN